MVRGQLLRFLVVGCTNTAISFAAFFILITLLPAFHGKAAFVQAVSYALGIIWSYTWNRLWTFRSSGTIRTEIRRFFIVNLSMLALSTAGLHVTVDILGSNPWLSWVGVMAVVTTLNFMLTRTFVFCLGNDSAN